MTELEKKLEELKKELSTADADRTTQIINEMCAVAYEIGTKTVRA